MQPTELRARLLELAEPAYRDFSAGLLPPGTKLLGVRLPALRRLARQEAACPNWEQHLHEPVGNLEEELLRAFLPGYARGLNVEQRLDCISLLIPRWNNWSLCDSAASTYSFARSARECVWEWLQPWIADAREYPSRFAVVMLLQHYSQEARWLPQLMEALHQVSENGYYTDMAVAWCACELILRHREAAPLIQPKSPLCLPPRRVVLTRRKLSESRRKPR